MSAEQDAQVKGEGRPAAQTADASGQGDLLSKISTEMVRAQKGYFGKGPTKAKSYMLDDFLIIVMRGGLTVAEETMLEAEREDLVRSFRQEFENEMAERLTGMIEDLTGRKVVTYQSQILFDPDIVFEIFVFDEPAEREEIRATAEAQLAEDGPTGEVSTKDVAADVPPDTER